jgi:hypothetical protein
MPKPPNSVKSKTTNDITPLTLAVRDQLALAAWTAVELERRTPEMSYFFTYHSISCCGAGPPTRWSTRTLAPTTSSTNASINSIPQQPKVLRRRRSGMSTSYRAEY